MQYLRRIPYYAVIALLVYMPFHIFLSQSVSLLSGGLDAWKIAKDVVLACAVLFTICLVFWEKQGSRAFWALTGLTALYGLLHLLVWLANPDIYGRSAVLGMVLNLRVPALAILGYGAYLLTPTKFAFSSLMKIVLSVSTVVVILGLLQYLLPKDILTHVGYSLDRGVRPAFFIDDNPAFPRIMSTLREPNALGAYLLVPIGILTGLALTVRQHARRIMVIGLLVLHVLAVYLTYSRSALGGMGITIGLVVLLQYREQVGSLVRRWWLALLIVTLLGIGAGTLIFRSNPHIQGIISHSTDNSVDLDSNDYHWLYIKQGLEGIGDKPLGHGPGTAGLASIQNPQGGVLTENYYLQIGYEVGLIGLGIFVALQGFVLYSLLRSKRSLVQQALIATFWAYVGVNMLLHSWSNEAVAVGWWLLAGVVLAVAQSKTAKPPAKKVPRSA